MAMRMLTAMLFSLLALNGAALAKTAQKDPAILQAEVTVGHNIPLFLSRLQEAATAHGFAMRITTVKAKKHAHKKVKRHAPVVPEAAPYDPTYIEIWRADLKVLADNSAREDVFLVKLYNWILTPRYVTDKTLGSYRNDQGTPAEEFTQALKMAATSIPGTAIHMVQPETQNPQDGMDKPPATLRLLQVTVDADHAAAFMGSLRHLAQNREYAVYSRSAGRGVHDSYFSDELLITVNSNRAGDFDIAFYEGDAGNSAAAFNAFVKGLKSILQDIPYALVHERKSYNWPAREKESY